jgi:hypothetical protein
VYRVTIVVLWVHLQLSTVGHIALDVGVELLDAIIPGREQSILT